MRSHPGQGKLCTSERVHGTLVHGLLQSSNEGAVKESKVTLRYQKGWPQWLVPIGYRLIGCPSECANLSAVSPSAHLIWKDIGLVTIRYRRWEPKNLYYVQSDLRDISLTTGGGDRHVRQNSPAVFGDPPIWRGLDFVIPPPLPRVDTNCTIDWRKLGQ